ncbi:hypothetical protein [Tautonia plasticadhaerens]|uniref:Uncharacterized protein n=1 Tax=Tautonia plasticadhaerens TaxID=2527974 RepID=A0A518H7Y7_9BACT|nr:hypothetical protein [Tautonia plasticadhaerens]QDV36979.1 hypothetical protein ElP_49100 [Tautonia plasticadhaerens]
MVNNSSTGGHGRECEGRAIDGRISSDREDSGLAALEGMTLEELAAIASKEIGDSRQLQAEAVGLARRSTVTFYRAGRALWCARKKLKGKGNRAWTRWQRDNGISITSAWQAIRLYEEAEGEEAVAGLTRTQALKKYGITKPKQVQPQQGHAGGGEAPEAVGTAPLSGSPASTEDTPPQSLDLRLASDQDGKESATAPGPELSEAGQDGEVEEPQADPTTPPATETLLIIARRLETLERDIRGGDLGDEAHALIDRAMATLLRIKGDVAPVAEAA